jgi:cobalt/nickel transport protein
VRKGLRLAGLAVVVVLVLCTSLVCTGEKWPGVDEAVVKKFAEQAGHPAREPFIDTTQGDMLLFCFLAAGTAGGFVMGYYCRALFPPKSRQTDGLT